MSLDLRPLIAHGYLPKELPQCFTSVGLVRALRYSRIRGLRPTAAKTVRDAKFRVAELGRHNLARPGRLRRALGVPNPFQFINLCSELVASWTEISSYFTPRSLSITTPAFGGRRDERALQPSAGPPDWPRYRAYHRATGRYLLLTDIQDFYSSIYTHSIPWALHSKRTAKSSRTSYDLLGNRIDLRVQECQDGQTRGIPIGPDTSFVIAELLLRAVDKEFLREFPSCRGFRAIDNFELSFDSRSDAEHALAYLQTTLARFELSLSQKKTSIRSLPVEMESLWPRSLSSFVFRDRARDQIADVLQYFSLAFETALATPEEPVLRYAVARLRGDTLNRQSWQTYQDCLLQCILSESGTLRFALDSLKRYNDAGFRIDKDRVGEVLGNLVIRHLQLGHDSEVAWALWAFIVLDIPIDESVVRTLGTARDSVIPLLALHASRVGLCRTPLDTSAWAPAMTSEGLWSDRWLLSYEACLRGWLPSASSGADHIQRDEWFRLLRNSRVSFYREQAPATRTGRWRRRLRMGTLIGYDLFGGTTVAAP